MPKFFVSKDQVNNQTITIQGKDVNHIKNVLRMKNGDILHIGIIENQTDCVSKIEKIADKHIICQILEYQQKNAESNIKVSIFQGLPKKDKMELIIQKAVELGVYDIYPVQMKRCIVQLKDENKKNERWQTISEVASKQCGRNIIPRIQKCVKISEICNRIPEYDAILVAYEEERINKLKIELQSIKKQFQKDILKLGIVIGTEGGLELEEVEQLQKNGARIITLGNRILRTETVALNVLSNIMYEFEK